ncbi:efflux transporter outer membrane subunit [Undibacterium oligocarboniphilum]|uniref:Efflux transporter outer membrane subunit n=2 Tax=Undibacterium oligocarboniphilum TaxID=666702 RepID=A0A850QDT9_9BURK|nr:efflux transporter outer membrane subunit [Undibacterium oligocarboniphilum]NVO78622.1 efflux transporter outer membrane subunit [Undibacterium oligocarboniphilum]
MPSKAALPALLAALLGGCAVGPDFQRPATPQTSSYTTRAVTQTGEAGSAEAPQQQLIASKTIDAQWWTAFGSETINQLVAAAFSHNPGIDGARAALRQARETAEAQRSSYFPTLQASYSPSKQRNAVGTISPTLTTGDPVYTLHTAQLNISFVPDVFGLNRRTVESLTAQQEVQQFQLEATYLTLASNVVSNAIQLALVRAQIQANQEIIRAAESALEGTRRQAAAGFASALDIAAQETALAQAKLALPPLQKQLDQTRDLLAVLTGVTPAEMQPLQIDLADLKLPAELPVSLPSQLIEQRPDIRAAEASVHAASAQVGVALANRLPQFSLSATDGGTATVFSSMFASGNQFWSVTGNATQTLFDFGNLKHKQNAAEAALDQAAAQYKTTVLSAFQNVADTLYALDADSKAVSVAASAESIAAKNLKLTREQFRLGAIPIAPVLIAEQAWQQSRLSLLQNQAARYSDSVALFQALGGGWWNRPELANADPRK